MQMNDRKMNVLANGRPEDLRSAQAICNRAYATNILEVGRHAETFYA